MDSVSLSSITPKTPPSTLYQSKTQDSLTKTATNRSRDTIKLTYLLLQTRLSDDLDQTIGNHIGNHPEMKDNFFLAFLPEGVEVVEKTAAQKHLTTQQASHLEGDPVGYFSKEEFSLKTPESGPYRELKEKLNQYFIRNEAVFSYFRNQPETSVDPSSLYNRPGEKTVE